MHPTVGHKRLGRPQQTSISISYHSEISRRLPVLHVFTELPIDFENLARKIGSKFHDDENVKLAIFYDVRYHRAFEMNQQVFEELKNSNKSFSDIVVCPPSLEHSKAVVCGRICLEDLNEDWKILFIGKSEKFLLLLALTCPSAQSHLVFDPASDDPAIEESSISVKRALMKRFYLIERTRDATRIGILVGTLGVTRYRNIIDHVKGIIKDSGKKSYTFLVGKPNVPKLANFSEVLFCLRPSAKDQGIA